MDCSAFRVVALDPSLSESLARHQATVCYWPDPRTRQLRPYLIVQSSDDTDGIVVCEMQSLGEPNKEAYSSLMVKDTLLAQSQIMVVTPVDPLFFVLSHLTKDGTNANLETQQTWQPLEQLKSSLTLPPSTLQLTPLLQSLALGDDDDDLVFKFDKKRIFEWLTSKQKAVLQVLTQQSKQETQQNERGKQEGAFCSGFCMTQDDDLGAKQENEASRMKKQATRLEHESIQVVCNYLDKIWQSAWLAHLGIESEETVLESKKAPTTRKRKPTELQERVVVSTESEYTVMSKAVVVPKKEAKPISAGAKRLAKVNTKGMKKMSSFFQKKKENQPN